MSYKTLKVTAIQPYERDGRVSYPINVVFEGEESVIWRSKKQIIRDLLRSGSSFENVSSFIGGQVSGDIIRVKKGDKYTVVIKGESGKKDTTEERTYESEQLIVKDGFLSFEQSMNRAIASEVARALLQQQSIATGAGL